MQERRFAATESAIATASTITIEVRHGRDCPAREAARTNPKINFRDDQPYKGCDCRKQFYIYENGKDRRVSAKTRSWEKAEALKRQMENDFDPAIVEARRYRAMQDQIRAEEERKKAEAQAKRIPIVQALKEWRGGMLAMSKGRTSQFRSVADKLIDWAEEQKLVYLDEIKRPILYNWRAKWSPEAENPRDALAPSTQNQYVAHLHRFFRWAIESEYLDRDPSTTVKRIAHEHIQTRPLEPAREQFAAVLEATRAFDAHRVRQSTPLYGRDLRAIFLLQRWTGIRIIDAIALARSAVRFDTSSGQYLMTLKTQKTGYWIKDRPLPLSVVEALQAIPVAEHVRPGYYFWSAGMKDVENLTSQWLKRIVKLNECLTLADENQQPVTFRSHMLRDTFAVELLGEGTPIEEVSELLTHESIEMTQRYYAPWVSKRRELMHRRMIAAMENMGEAFTHDAAPQLLPPAPQRVM